MLSRIIRDSLVIVGLAVGTIIIVGRYLIAIISVLLGAILWELYRFPAPYSMDFYQFYYDLFAIVRGASVYDVPSHVAISERFLGGVVTLNPPAYPSWYYLTFLPLGKMSVESAARLWLYINVVFYLFTLNLLMQGLDPRRKLPLLLVAVIFGPFIGHIIVGQQTIVVLLGVGIFKLALERHSRSLRMIALALLSFKPHLGLLIVAAVFLWCLIHDRKLLANLAVELPLVILLLQGVSSLLLNDAGLDLYLVSLKQLSALSINKVCDSCSSISLMLQGALFPSEVGIWGLRLIVSGALFLVFVALAALFESSKGRFLMLAVCIVTLTAPYIRNYDLVLLMAPLTFGYTNSRSGDAVASEAGKWLQRLIVCLLVIAITICTLWFDREWQNKFMWIASVAALAVLIFPKLRVRWC